MAVSNKLFFDNLPDSNEEEHERSEMEEYATVKKCISHEETLASKKSIVFFTNPSSCWYFIIVVGFLFSVTAFAMATHSVLKDNSSDLHYSAKVGRQQQKSSVCNDSNLKSKLEEYVKKTDLLKTELKNLTKMINQTELIKKKVDKQDTEIKILHKKFEDTALDINGLKFMIENVKKLQFEIVSNFSKAENKFKDIINKMQNQTEQIKKNFTMDLEKLFKKIYSIKKTFEEHKNFSGYLWTQYENGTSYYFSRERKKWKDAANFCDLSGAKLTSIHSNEENTFITNKLHSLYGNISSGYHGASIGLHDINLERHFRWVDGTKTDYLNWASGEPNNLNNEDCVSIDLKGKWNDNSCDTEFYFICKKN
ncbi:C-type lectin domain family 4 member F-like [Hydractinia symbiolongicarpus]|uniref:C-type lectin domain family 4 member F-like n=1 Tax=Hydractinia symbiolongicarpus TaxID=13093 RepID=UPI00254C3288|nr:C-type lectin domain family 4 member F-like [Hydractinia symbiolongicarpus]